MAGWGSVVIRRPSTTLRLCIFLIVAVFRCPNRWCHTWIGLAIVLESKETAVGSIWLVGSTSRRYRLDFLQVPTAMIDEFLDMTTSSLLKVTTAPFLAAARTEKRFAPSFGTKRTSCNMLFSYTPLTLHFMSISPRPVAWSGFVSDPIPFTGKLLGWRGINSENIHLWSDMCFEAPESANHSLEFLLRRLER